jgi:hypothetical protein
VIASTSASSRTASTPTAEPTPYVVPWIDTPASEAELAAQKQPLPNPPVVGPACASGDLVVSSDDGAGDGASGHQFYYVEVRNSGSRRCVLEGYPDVVATVDGQPQDLKLSHRTYLGFDDLIKVALMPGAKAAAALDLHERVDDCPGRQAPPLENVSVTLGDQRVEVIPAAVAYCDLTVGAWRSVADPMAESAPAIAAQFKGVTGRLEGVPARAQAGEQVTYIVALTNHTTQAIDLTPCPIYEVGGLGKGTYRLNCAVASTLPAHSTTRFAMAPVEIPDDWPAAATVVKLAWQIPGTDVLAFPTR